MSMHGVNVEHIKGRDIPLDDGSTPHVVDQSKVKETDATEIMKRAAGGGIIPQGGRVARFGDVSEFGDFMESQNKVAAGMEIWSSLSADVRASFANDPKKFFAFATKDENKDAVLVLRYGKSGFDSIKAEEDRKLAAAGGKAPDPVSPEKPRPGTPEKDSGGSGKA